MTTLKRVIKKIKITVLILIMLQMILCTGIQSVDDNISVHSDIVEAPADQGSVGQTPIEEVIEIQPEIIEVQPEPVMVYYEGDVRHIFFHPLVAWTDMATASSRRQDFLDWFVTADEYKQILYELYMSDYVLVHIDELYEVTYSDNGSRIVRSKNPLIPEGKKPLALSIDDLSYHAYMRDGGVVHKLVLDENGEIAAWTDNESGGEISYDLDVVTILEGFIRQYPDFSIRGARGIIALTGYEGVLGYQTQRTNASNYQDEVEKAIAVANRLRELNWRFASHSWGHRNLPEITMALFIDDANRWDREVRPIVGDTDLFIYPYGARLESHAEKHRMLRERGFAVFFGVGEGYGFTQYPGFLFTTRRNIDGYYFRIFSNRNYPDKLFDFDRVIDREFRGISGR